MSKRRMTMTTKRGSRNSREKREGGREGWMEGRARNA